MTAHQLMKAHLKAFPTSHYFDAETLKFFGEQFSKMRVLQRKAVVEDSYGEKYTCYVLSKSSRGWDGKRHRTYGYFDTKTFEHIIPKMC